MKNNERIVIIGATSAIAEQCAREWTKKGVSSIILVGRNQKRLKIISADLMIRSPSVKVECLVASFIDPISITRTIDLIFESGPIDIALIAHGMLPEQSECQGNLTLCKHALEVNGISPVLYAEALAENMSQFNYGSIAIISSVAGDRGRKSNYIYGSAKGLITRYAQGLQHRFAKSNICVSLIKPGPTKTPMTSSLNGNEKFSTPEEIAKIICSGIEKKKMVIYAPKKWQLIMMIIQHLPKSIFNRLNI